MLLRTRGKTTRDLHVHFQFEFIESVSEVRRDLVKVDGEMGVKMGVKMGVMVEGILAP